MMSPSLSSSSSSRFVILMTLVVMTSRMTSAQFYNPFQSYLDRQSDEMGILQTTPATTTTEMDVFHGMYFQEGYAVCEKFEDDGSMRSYLYDECTSFCCGGTVYRNRTGLDCCGSSSHGSPYMPRYQRCCKWWTGHGKAHTKARFRGAASGCCGADLIFWGVQQCCYGDTLPPQVYDRRRHICCQSRRVTASTMFPWQSKCCGHTQSYDHRMQSCPCGDGRVLNQPEVMTDCCYTPDGLGNPYNLVYDICCNGQVGRKDTHFCCGERAIGKIGEQICCDGMVTDLAVPDPTMTECCQGVPYDPSVHACCKGKLKEIQSEQTVCCGFDLYNPDLSICCDENLWSKEHQGTECCASFAFFPEQGMFCCDGEIQVSEFVDGDACCGTGMDKSYYYKDDNYVCCDGTLSFGGSGEDSCCGGFPFNNKTGICCGGEVFDRNLGDTCCNGGPYFKSHPQDRLQTICCPEGAGGPYKQPQCCNGLPYDSSGGQICCQDNIFGVFRQPACCVDVGFDVATHQCCQGRVRDNPPLMGGRAACCGSETYDTSRDKCCNDVIIPVPSYLQASQVECCADFDVYHPVSQLCCEGIVYNKTHRFASKCCGEMMFDIRKQVCCESQDTFYNPPVLYDFEFGRWNSKCCGSQLYDSNEQFCCEEIISEKIYEKTECCMGVPYDRTKEICCEGSLVPIGARVPYSRAECCGADCYFRGPQRCCMKRIYEMNRRTQRTCADFT